MADTQRQPNYQYTPSSAQSTRQILDSTSASTSSNTNDVPFRPQAFTRTSSNYAEAEARARAALADFTQASLRQDDGSEDGRKAIEDKQTTGTSGASVSWKPRYGRKQSWSQQDLRREMQMSVLMEDDADKGPGFSEVESGKTF